MKTNTQMPDVATSSHAKFTDLDWVGMSNIAMPIDIVDANKKYTIQAKIQVYVNLKDSGARGIHMSRLYLLISKLEKLDFTSAHQIMHELKESHKDISTNSKLQIQFDLPIKRKALLSDNYGWRIYPSTLTLTNKDNKIHTEVITEVTYSSTCPCSTALAQQLTHEAFKKKFSQNDKVAVEDVAQWLEAKSGMIASPHSQRSTAKIRVALEEKATDFHLLSIIDNAEKELQTVVQSAVKREDEQEFARLNALNTLFCEDSARKIKRMLNKQEYLADFWVRIDHYESLHAHDAVAIAVKGVTNGFSPEF